MTFWRLEGQTQLSELLALQEAPRDLAGRSGGPPNFFFLLATRRKHREGEVRLVQGLNHLGALRVSVKQRRERRIAHSS